MKQQVFSRQQSVLSVVFNCLFSGALSPPRRACGVLQALAHAKKKKKPYTVLYLSMDDVDCKIQGYRRPSNYSSPYTSQVSVFLKCTM